MIQDRKKNFVINKKIYDKKYLDACTGGITIK